MFASFPIFGITQGFLPIAGYNYGAKNWKRVHTTIKTSILYASTLATFVLVAIIFFSELIPQVFSKNIQVIQQAPIALRYVFMALPIVGIQLIGSAYFQAIGKAKPALLLTLTRQAFFFIPLLFSLPLFFGTLGVWLAFPLADLLATIVTVYFLNKAIRKELI